MSGIEAGMILPTMARLTKSQLTPERRAILLDVAKERALDGDSVGDAVFFDVVASGNAIDTYGTFMTTSTLRNFAADAAAGVSVLDSHRYDRLGFGQSVSGEYVQNGDTEQMRSTFYTIPGLALEGRSTDDYIRGMNAGLFRDISVGFYLPPDAEIRCTICGKDMLRRWFEDDGCRHFPGQKYTIEADGQTREVVAYGAIEGARLSEYSLVYDGATPGAGTVKARQMEDAGMLDPVLAGQLEQAYHTTFPRATGRIFTGFTPANGKGIIMPMTKDTGRVRAVGEEIVEDEEVTAAVTPDTEPDDEVREQPDDEVTVIEDVEAGDDSTDDVDDDNSDEEDDDESEGETIERSRSVLAASLRTALAEKYAASGIRFGRRVGETVDALAGEVVRLQGRVKDLKAERDALAQQASEGREYREALIEELKSEVIRASESDDDKAAKVERYVRIAEVSDLSTIRALRDDFADIAAKRYGTGRKSREAGTDGVIAPVVPDDAYDDV